MAYSPKDPTTVTSWDELRDWVQDELGFVSQEFEAARGRRLQIRHREPDKPREGMLEYADGVDWNPGGGKGVYVYDGTEWVKL